MSKGTTATTWDIYDSFHNQNKTTESEFTYPESNLNGSKIQEKRGETSSSSTVGTSNSTWENIKTNLCTQATLLTDLTFFLCIKASFAITGMYHFLIFNFLRQYHQFTVRKGHLWRQFKGWARPTADLAIRLFPTQLISNGEDHCCKYLAT